MPSNIFAISEGGVVGPKATGRRFGRGEAWRRVAEARMIRPTCCESGAVQAFFADN
jgi:hypothetical protein